MRSVAKSANLLLRVRTPFSNVVHAESREPTKRQYLQFSKRRLIDFGQLPAGEIPDALKYSRPVSINKLSNKVSVISESWKGHKVGITVTIKAGSRQENLANSSVAQFAARVGLQGTQNLTRDKVEQAIDRFGNSLFIKVSRELTEVSIFCEPNEVKEGLQFLSEILLKPSFNPVCIEALKPTIHKNALLADPITLAIENVHYTAFRDHYMGHPSLGVRDNVYSITSAQVQQYHNMFYTGNNIVVSGAGEIDSAKFKELSNEYFGSVVAERGGQIENADQVYFTPSLMFQRDDQIINSTIGVGFLAPSWRDPDFFAMKFFKRILGEYRIDKYTGAHLNAPHLQYNLFHYYLGQYPDVSLHKPFYFPYSDVGIFMNFIFTNQIFNREMLLMSQNTLSVYAQNINQVQIFRARNKYWNDLLQYHHPSRTAAQNAKQYIYLDRVVSRTEVATRISNMIPTYIQKIASKWFWDQQLAITASGPLSNVMDHSHYHRPFRRSTLGEYATIDVHYNQ